MLKKKPFPNILINLSIMYLFYSTFKNYYKTRYNPESTLSSLILGYQTEILGMYILCLHIFFTCLYYFQFPLFEKMKYGDLKWPWVENYAKFKKLLPHTIKVYLFNQFLLVPAWMYFLSLILKNRIDLESIPSFYVFWFKVYLCIFIEDFFFYWSHRTLHRPFFYNKIHKLHHRHHNVIHLSFAYAHPVEFIMGNIMPSLMAGLILGNNLHFITLSAFILVRTVESMETHSGYNFTFSMFKIFPFTTSAEYHGFHHFKNIGNYSSFFRIWDTIFGTNQYFLEYQMKKKTLMKEKLN